MADPKDKFKKQIDQGQEQAEEWVDKGTDQAKEWVDKGVDKGKQVAEDTGEELEETGKKIKGKVQ